MAAGLILFVGLTAYVASEPWLFPSLGPTAYLLAVLPDLPSSRLYNCVVGHFVGIGSGFAAVAIFNAWESPIVPLNDVSLPRLGGGNGGHRLDGARQPPARARAIPPPRRRPSWWPWVPFRTAWSAALIVIGS